MRAAVVVFILAFVPFAVGQGDVSERVTQLEARVAELEEMIAELGLMLSVPAPPPTRLEVEGFVFERVASHQTSGYAEFLGEVSTDGSFERVTFRVTFYAEDGSILGTDTFSVERVGDQPRTFSTLVRGVEVPDIASLRLEVDRVR